MILRNISEAKAELSALVEAVLSGRTVIIARAGKPVVRLTPYERKGKTRAPGSLKGKVYIAPDFDELPDDIAEAFGVK